ncbi:ABC-type dipeptide/oligopeptide/nickel transport system, permease component [Saccharomonospora marina XMU15]|uniref:ABC-type dipeptide/oligopeptide/nickel transport system, permease component n=1 Tax=Saccharomonospora marina XMU15 TaxID=882083 RepID=H5X9D9_9PSEU|nr:ABC transporter permease [Saccharomonospora marina]EHR50304.1 ABC-type dipeptide/oligopeptide/nickel transport system, permease component [Saccharomonospora marina XMU15]
MSDVASSKPRGRAGRVASFDVAAWLCGGWLVTLVLAAVFAPLLPLGEHADIANTIDSPALARPDLFSEHPLGTNNFGLDLLARVIHGARASLVVSVGAVLIGMVVGGSIGIVAGYFRKLTDSVIGVLTNSLLAVPPLILLIALATVLRPNLRNIAIALSLLALPSMIRMARASTLAFAQRDFVLAAKSMGASRLRVMTRELLPNVILPLASYGMVMVSVLIVAEASLSFLGLGIQQPDPSWGNMIAEGEGDTFAEHPHVVLVPGIALLLTVFSFNLLGEKARKRWDPRVAKL